MRRNYWRIWLLVCVLALGLTACIGRERAMEQQSMLDEYSTITYYFGENVIGSETVVPGKMLSRIPVGDYDWQDADGDPVDLTAYVVTEKDASFYIRTAALSGDGVRFREGHARYITARGNQFFPDEAVTRGELAEMLCTLLDTEDADPAAGYAFSDVSEFHKNAESIALMSAMGIMNGYVDRTFRPDEAVTRAEFMAVLNRMSGEKPEDRSGEGLAEAYWAGDIIGWAKEKGLITGYGDEMTYPERPVNRAEAVVIINRFCGRVPNRVAIDLATEILPYVDVSREHWAFYDIIDACYSNELMAYILGEAADAQPGFILIDGELCHINPETLRLDYYIQGFHTIDGGLYYVAQNGYFIQRFEKGLEELDGSMFYVTEDDGPFLVNEEYGYLYFGEDGRYTSGSVVVDEHVDRILAGILYNDALSQEEKLYEAYCAIRDGGYFYMHRNTGWIRGSTSWALECAEVMYETKRGICYYWAASFLYLARRLGYQAYPVCGGVGTQNQRHAWVVIEWDDGNEYIFDVELEWAYRNDFYQQGYTATNMFKQPRNATNVIYVFPGESPKYYGVAEEESDGDIFDVPADMIPPEEEPEIPDTPEEPDVPVDPDAPVDPEVPEGTDTPTDPETPADPDAPEDPEQSEQPENPENPEVTNPPEETDTPVEPEQPQVPETPVEPETPPAQTETPVEPAPEPETGGELAA